MKTLAAMEPHYIRCVKPNSLNKPMLFEPANVLHQLRCGGVLEAVRTASVGRKDSLHDLKPLYRMRLLHEFQAYRLDNLIACKFEGPCHSAWHGPHGLMHLSPQLVQLCLLFSIRLERLSAALSSLARC